METRNDAHNRSELSEQRDSRLQLSALKCGQPVFTVHFDVLELHERRATHSGNAASCLDGHFAVADLDHPPSHTDDLFPVRVEVHVAEKQNRVSPHVVAGSDTYAHDGNPAAAGIEHNYGVATVEGVVSVAGRGKRMHGEGSTARTSVCNG